MALLGHSTEDELQTANTAVLSSLQFSFHSSGVVLEAFFGANYEISSLFYFLSVLFATFCQTIVQQYESASPSERKYS